MAKKSGRTVSTADQPKVSSTSLTRLSSPANLQYRVTGIKTMSARSPKRARRSTRY